MPGSGGKREITMTFVTKIISVCLCVALAATAGIAAGVKTLLADKPEDSAAQEYEERAGEYPYILVPGMGGWGPTSNIDNVVHYWGATMGDMVEHLDECGFEAYETSLGLLSSAWDRACELYAQLTGTRVDYGKAHSEKYGHERYGRTYDKPLIPRWDSEHKVNLYGHSFGGSTARLLASLMGEGSAEERKATPAGELSPLFEGGKADYIFSVTTICSPNSGTTLYYALGGNSSRFVMSLYYISAMLAGNVFPELVDFQLEHFNVTPGIGEQSDLTPEGLKAIKLATEKFAESDDNVFYDVSLKGADELNKLISVQDNIYYFSFAAQATRVSAMTGNSIPADNLNLALWGFAYAMGKYSGTTEDGFVVDESWQPSDGVVNTVSALAPPTEPSADFDAENIRPGVWNNMPIIYDDHGAVIGLFSNFEFTSVCFEKHMELINTLSEKR